MTVRATIVVRAMSPGSAPSPAGQSSPAPSAAQNTPNEVVRTPTTNLIVFSGMRVRGRTTAAPTAVTVSTAHPAAAW